MSHTVFTTEILDEARAFFEDRGSYDYEGTGVIAAGPDRVSRRLVVPDQRAGPDPNCWVEVTEHGKLQLAVELGQGETYIGLFSIRRGAVFSGDPPIGIHH